MQIFISLKINIFTFEKKSKIFPHTESDEIYDQSKKKKKSLNVLVKNIQVQHFNGTSLVTFLQDIWDSRKRCFSEEGRKAETDDL